MAKKQAKPRLYTFEEWKEEYDHGLRQGYQRGYADGEQHVWDELAEYRTYATVAAVAVGVLCCVAYTLSSIAYWLFS
jgi:uncharacterized membrane protein YgdD (TMEM256/DUF423 family)